MSQGFDPYGGGQQGPGAPAGGGWGAAPQAPIVHAGGGPTMPGRPAEVAEVFEAFKLTLRRAGGGLMGAWAALSLVNLIAQSPSWVTSYLQQTAIAEGDFGAVGTYGFAMICASLVQMGIGLVVGAGLLGLFRPLRRLLVEGPLAAGSAGEYLKIAFTGFFPKLGIMLLVSLAIGIGFVFCILPGFVAIFFLMLAPYLVAAVDHSIGDAFKRSFELAKKNVGPLIVTIVVYLVVVGVAVAIGAALGAILTAVLGATGLLIAQPIAALIGVVVGYFGFVFFGAAAVAIETADSGVQLAKG